MKIWCLLSRNPANRCRESCALWSSFPVADVSKMLLGKLLKAFSLHLRQQCCNLIVSQELPKQFNFKKSKRQS